METPEHMWATAASLHMEGNAEKWLHMHKQKHGLGSWDQFMASAQQKFGTYEYKHAVDEILELKQNGTVEEYVNEFESLQYQIEMYDQGMGDTYFIPQFVKGLKPEIRYQVQGQVPATMERAAMLAKI
jgi:lysine/ornithine N-monooxygenase